MKKNISVIAILLLIFAEGCYYDKADIVYPSNANAVCDTTAIKYSTDIVSILKTNCYECHSIANANASASGNVLEGYANLKPYLGRNGVLMQAITHTGGASPMPKDRPKLSDCNIAKITAWINNNSPNN